MIEKHRGPGRHDSLLKPLPPDDEGSGWMISYIDVMTLLVVLLVLIIVLGRIGLGLGPEDTAPAASASSPEASGRVAPQLGVPLPASLKDSLSEPLKKPIAGPAKPVEDLSPRAISAALGAAGLPPRRASMHTPVVRAPAQAPARSPRPPALLARPSESQLAAQAVSQPPPQPVLPSGLDLSAPLANYLLVLTDRPPSGFEAVSVEAVAAAGMVAEAWREAPYLPDLEGMEVSRIPEGVRLRVEDRLLFPTAEAELTDAGRDLVVGRLREMVERHPGEVAVEGHSDSRSINTERFPSNWALSSARAIAIVEALVEAGVAPDRLRAVGLADTRPLAGNDSAEGRARNRRVEVTIQTH